MCGITWRDYVESFTGLTIPETCCIETVSSDGFIAVPRYPELKVMDAGFCSQLICHSIKYVVLEYVLGF